MPLSRRKARHEGKSARTRQCIVIFGPLFFSTHRATKKVFRRRNRLTKNDTDFAQEIPMLEFESNSFRPPRVWFHVLLFAAIASLGWWQGSEAIAQTRELGEGETVESGGISLVTPTQGQTFLAGTDIQISVEAPAGGSTWMHAARVEFTADGVLLGARTSSPFTFTWNDVRAGTYVIQASAIDHYGDVLATSDPLGITVQGPLSVGHVAGTYFIDVDFDNAWTSKGVVEWNRQVLFTDAEDFDFGRGQFVTTEPIGVPETPYRGGAYEGKGDGLNGDGTSFKVDYYEVQSDNSRPVYRPNTGVEAAKRNNETIGNDRGAFEVDVNHVVGWNDAGDWYNYTREFPLPPRNYYIYARLASEGDDMHARLDRVTTGHGTQNQTLEKLGEFKASATGDWEDFTFVPLRDEWGNMARVPLSGRTTLRFTVLPGQLDFDYLVFVAPNSDQLIFSSSFGPAVWETAGMDLSAKSFDGAPGIPEFTENGIGVAGGGGAEIHFDGSNSQNLAVTFPSPVSRIAVMVSNLIPTEGEGERGMYVAYDSEGNEIVQETFGPEIVTQSPGVGSFLITTETPVKRVVFSAIHYVSGQLAENGDSSDYFVKEIRFQTVSEDLVPPEVLSGNNVGNVVGLCFSEPVEPLVSANKENYRIEGANVEKARILGDHRKVALIVDGDLPSEYVVEVSGVTDLHGNSIDEPVSVMLENSGLNSTTLKRNSEDPETPGHVYSCRPGDYNLLSKGSDLWNEADAGFFVYEKRTGNFDIAVRVNSLERAHEWTKAGLMAREELDGESAMVMSLVTPAAGRNSIVAQRRLAGELAERFPGFNEVDNVSYPDAWLRLKRVGNTFTALFSKDGVRWTQYAQTEQNLRETVYLGMALSSHSPGNSALAEFRSFQDVTQRATTISYFAVEPFIEDKFIEGTRYFEIEDFNGDIDGDGFGGESLSGINGGPVGQPYNGGGYAGVSAIHGVDYFEQGNHSEGILYRHEALVQSGQPPVQFLAFNSGSNAQRGGFELNSNFKVAYTSKGDWYNFTREFPDQDTYYHVYLSLSGVEEAPRAGLERVTSDPTAPDQTTERLGEFYGPPSGDWNRSALYRMTVPNRPLEIADIDLSGLETLRVVKTGGNFDWDYVALVPAKMWAVDITTPQSHASGLVELTVEFSNRDESEIQSVEYFVNGESIGVVENSPFTFEGWNATSGTHILKVEAMDSSGDVMTDEKTIVIEPPIVGIERENGTISVVWDGDGTLQTAPEVGGPWQDITDPAPITLSFPVETTPQSYFRIISSSGQISEKLFGFINLEIQPGYSMIGNPLDSEVETVGHLFDQVPPFTTLFEFNPNTGDFDTNTKIPLTEEGSDGTGGAVFQEPGNTLEIGEGRIIHNPATDPFTITFIGEVPAEHDTLLPSGFSIKSSPLPKRGRIQTDLNFPTQTGDTVFRLSSETTADGNDNYTYQTATYMFDSWVPEELVILPGESVWVLKSSEATWHLKLDLPATAETTE